MRFRTLALACLIVVIGSGLSALAETASQAAPPKTIEELQKAARAILEKHKVPGAGLTLVARDRVVWAGGVGKADLGANRDVTADTLFRVGSISKTFIGLALVKLAEEGKLDLNAKLADIAPEVKIENPWEGTDPVRVVHLLEHTAGFDDMQYNEVYNLDDPPDIPLQEVFARFPKPQRVRWMPGTRWAYSNPGYALAGYVVEKVTGRRFEDYVKEEILKPLGMVNSDFRLTDDTKRLLAQGYAGKLPRPATYRDIYLRPAGDLKASPAELALLVQMLLNRGRVGEHQLIKPESLERMERPETSAAARAGLKNGYGLAIYASLDRPRKTLGHSGGIEGFLSSYRYLPQEGVGYVALVNSGSGGAALDEISKLLFGYVTAGLPAVQPAAPAQLSPAQLEKFAGFYEPANPRNQKFAFLDLVLGGRRIFVEQGRLYEKRLLRAKEALIPVSENQFRREKEPEASTIFFTEPDGAQVLAPWGLYARKAGSAWPQMRLILLVSGVAVMLTAPLFALLWIPRKLLGRMREVQHLGVRGVSLLAVVSLAAIVFLVSRLSPADGARSSVTVALYVATLVFPVLSVCALLLGLWSFRWEVGRAVRIHSLLVAVACCGIAVYLGYWGLLGLKLWE